MRHVNALVPAVVPPNCQPLALDAEQEGAFVAEHPRVHLESTAQRC